ncbi:MAG: SCP2 sterol-binding domain-containing protein [Pseudomonadota bacterium]
MTPREIFETRLPGNLNKEKAEKIGGTFQFTVTGDNGGTWHVDLTKDADWVGEGALDDAKCKITIADADWVGIFEGSVNPQMAFMSGKLKVAGDMSLALKLQSLIS